jgi:uncharacterized protein YjbI with pentapeptide repeats
MARLEKIMQNNAFKLLLGIALLILILLVGELIYGIFNPNQTPAWLGTRAIENKDGTLVSPAKTLWDLVDLLIMPLVLAMAAFLFNRAEQQRTELRAEERVQEETLDQYIEQMSKLMLEQKLLESSGDMAVRTVARTLTRVTLFNVNSKRKSTILRFLKEAGLINDKNSIVSLAGTDFRNTNLHGSRLQRLNLANVNFIGAVFDEASLAGTNLMHANCSQASLRSADLQKANLQEVNFSGADLSQANLDEAKLVKSNLRGAILKGAKLRGDLTGIKMENAKYDDRTKWPEQFDPGAFGAVFEQ